MGTIAEIDIECPNCHNEIIQYDPIFDYFFCARCCEVFSVTRTLEMC